MAYSRLLVGQPALKHHAVSEHVFYSDGVVSWLLPRWLLPRCICAHLCVRPLCRCQLQSGIKRFEVSVYRTASPAIAGVVPGAAVKRLLITWSNCVNRSRSVLGVFMPSGSSQVHEGDALACLKKRVPEEGSYWTPALLPWHLLSSKPFKALQEKRPIRGALMRA